MQRELPVRPNLEHLKSQAKDLLEAFRRGEREALERIRASLPSAHGLGLEQVAALTLALHDAQSAIAREYGFASFAELRAHVERAAVSASLSPEALRALLERHAAAPPPREVQQAILSASQQPLQSLSLPAELPLVAVRNAMLSVGAIAPLMIGRASSFAALQAAQRADNLLAIFSQKDQLHEAPGSADLHPVGCAVVLTAVIPADAGSWIVVRALEWVELQALTQENPYLVAQVTRFTIQQEDSEDVRRLEQHLRERVRAFVAGLPQAEALLRATEQMGPLELADATIANLKCSVDDKARYANERSLTRRLEYLLTLFDSAA